LLNLYNKEILISMLFVTEPFLPPIEDYQAVLNGVWKRNHLTNNGPLVRELEERIPAYLGSVPMLYLGNGTIALQIALKALDITQEVITTPFSYVATASSIVWEGCTPVFADIDPESWNIDPASIEELITDRTEAILATHVFGNPCDVHAIKAIAERHGLKVIYDAAHAFGSKVDGESVFNFGDISTASFHATKLFHTIEGGAIFAKDDELLFKVARMRNFGHDGPERFYGVGINGKNSEFHAAMGIVNLAYISEIIKKRESDYKLYRYLLEKLDVQFQNVKTGHQGNQSYFPLLFSDERTLLEVMREMEKSSVFPRRYFYPCLDVLDYVKKGYTPEAHSISSRILCLPLSYQITQDKIKHVCKVIVSTSS
jgi:dTDP-4-amino-4,6-dideoxygalactose transaminase